MSDAVRSLLAAVPGNRMQLALVGVVGAVITMFMGMVVNAFNEFAFLVLQYFRRRVMVQLEVSSRDEAYRWLMHWLSAHPCFANSPQVTVSTSLTTCFGTSSRSRNDIEQEEALSGGGAGAKGGAMRKRVHYLPAPGDHSLRFQGRWVWVSRRVNNQSHFLNAAPDETLYLCAFGRSRQVLESLVQEAHAGYAAWSRGRTAVFSMGAAELGCTIYWQQVGSRPMRPLSSVVLPGRQAQELLEDCRDYLLSEEWYAHRGIPYRRGYLLVGPPGSGKTSLVTALAGELALPVYVITLSSPNMTDETLRNLLNTAAPRCILLLEDVDAAFTRRDTAPAAPAAACNAASAAGAAVVAAGAAAADTSSSPVSSGGSGGDGRAADGASPSPAVAADCGVGAGVTNSSGSLSFSGLLNAIDGVAAQEGRLLFMTTNHEEKLDPALVRPGRVDVRLEFGLATRDQIVRLFTSFYRDHHALSSPAPAHEAAPGVALVQKTGGCAVPVPAAAGDRCTSTCEVGEGEGEGEGEDATACGDAGAPMPPGARSHASSCDGTSDGACDISSSSSTAASECSSGARSMDEEGSAVGRQVRGSTSCEEGGKAVASHCSTVGGGAADLMQQQQQQLEQLAQRFAAAVPQGRSVTMACLQGHFMRHKGDPHAAVAAAPRVGSHTRRL